jgi:hypothetical protein
MNATTTIESRARARKVTIAQAIKCGLLVAPGGRVTQVKNVIISG